MSGAHPKDCVCYGTGKIASKVFDESTGGAGYIDRNIGHSNCPGPRCAACNGCGCADCGKEPGEIQAQADESAAELRRQGWVGDGTGYDIGVYHGDAEALAERLGRKASKAERSALEKAIRSVLTATEVAA